MRDRRAGRREALYVAPSATLWDIGARDTKYRDKPGTQGGITSIKLRPDATGRARVQVQAGGVSLTLPAPYAPGQIFHQAPSVTVRLLNSLGRCWEADFPVLSTRRNDDERFNAKVP